jgi:uncharacterized protein (TIGR03067 family)
VRRTHPRPVSLAGLALGLLAAGLAVHGVRAGDAKKDQEKLQGNWQATKLVFAGKDVPEDFLKGVSLLVQGNQMITTFTLGDQKNMQKASFKIDPAKKPKQIDLVAEDGPEKGKKVEGIYQIEGDTLKLAIVPPDGGGKRPENFNAGGDSTAVVMTFQRAKK